MTEKKAKKILETRLACYQRQLSGRDPDCLRANCVLCKLSYYSGTFGEYVEALRIVLEALKEGK